MIGQKQDQAGIESIAFRLGQSLMRSQEFFQEVVLTCYILFGIQHGFSFQP